MDFDFSDSDERIRAEAREWLAEHVTGRFTDLGEPLHARIEDRSAWERELGAGGWLGVAWPKQYGGRELTITEELVFLEEYGRARAPIRIGHFGDQLLAPTLIAHGSAEQCQRFLPPIRNGEVLWCQGFSEPGAGSDLASLSTKAVIDGGSWRIDGQKVWTSRAQYAQWIFAVCRTDPDSQRHHGLSFLLIPLDQPSVEVRPIRDITGNSHFCEVFFDGARTDADLVVGGPGKGWACAMTTLAAERGLGFLARQLALAEGVRDLIALAREQGLDRDPMIRQRLSRAHADTQLLKLSGYRQVSLIHAGKDAGGLGQLGKLFWSELHQRFAELALDVLGATGQLRGEGDAAEWVRMMLATRAETIYAGSSEIMKNLVAERTLGLPR